MKKSFQCATAGRIEANQMHVAMLLIEMPARRKLLTWHAGQSDMFARFLTAERPHPSIIRYWGINE